MTASECKLFIPTACLAASDSERMGKKDTLPCQSLPFFFFLSHYGEIRKIREKVHIAAPKEN